MTMFRSLPLLAAVLMASAVAAEPRPITWQAPPEPPRHGNFIGEPGVSIEAMTEDFLGAHPDIRWRREGLLEYSKQRHELAMKYFLRAARYADKAAQAMIAEMYWQGVGVPQDRALGYVWMDLAAERHYPNFLIMRERYWLNLDEAERRDAIERGQAVFDTYADDVAKPRLEKLLRHAARKITGSHLGFVSNLAITPKTGPLAGTTMTLRGDQLFDRKYWDPEQYWQMQDEVWKGPPKGEVHVGDLLEAMDAPLLD